MTTMTTPAKDHLIIFDTTMRDGEQSAGAKMSLEEKVRIGRALERMKVDVIEAGFAIASPGDFAAVKAVAETVKESVVCSLSRANARDIDAAGEALAGAARRRIHTFIATSPIHMEKKLRMSPDDVRGAAVGAIRHARKYTDDVEFSCEDAARSEVDFLCRIVEEAIAAGATTINLPDTVGYMLPHTYADLIKTVMTRVPNAHKAIFSVHCHNDLGMAVANSLAAVSVGARQVECTINGIGERAGNTALEEVVMALKTRADLFDVETRIETPHIVPISRLVAGITGFPVQPNKAIVGANAFAHASGIHQDGVLKHRETYEVMRAEDVGWSSNRLVLGKLSGRAAFKVRMEALGHVFDSDARLNEAFARFKDLADKKTEIFDEDLEALVTEAAIEEAGETVRFVGLEAISRTGEKPSATVRLSVSGASHEVSAEGDGPVDATFIALEKVLKTDSRLVLYSVNNITGGTDAQGEVTVRLSRQGRVVNGQGADTDIVVASAKAYISAVNRLGSLSEREHPQHQV